MAAENAKKQIMLIGSKESFLIRVLMKKMGEEGLEASFVLPEINMINEKWDTAALITYYLENDERIKPDVAVYLRDRMQEDDKQIILIGEKADTDKAWEQIGADLVAKTYPRPLDNDAYIEEASKRINEAKAADKRKNILIVDDDPTYIGLIRDWLKGTYKVSMANSGLQAIKWLGMNHADLILLDYEMPVTTGPQVLEMLRSDDETKNIPVIFLTGKSDKASVMQVVALKPEGYLLKSIQREELLEELKKFFLK